MAVPYQRINMAEPRWANLPHPWLSDSLSAFNVPNWPQTSEYSFFPFAPPLHGRFGNFPWRGWQASRATLPEDWSILLVHLAPSTGRLGRGGLHPLSDIGPERRGPRPAFEDGKPELTEAPAVACNRPRGNSGRLPLQSAVEGVPREAWSEGDEGRPALRFSLHPLIFPIGRNSATFLVIPALSTASTTSDISL